MEGSADRLRASRQKAGYDSASAAAEAFGWTDSTYRHHENGTRAFDVSTAIRYGRAFKVNPGWLLALDQIEAPPTPSRPEEPDTIYVIGTVAAGIWREQTEWPEHDRYPIPVGPSPKPGAERFAVEMDGLSMDLTIRPGSILECLRVSFGRVEPMPGDLVIVERVKHDLRETTCKRLIRADDGSWELRCESTRPEFQEPIPIGKPDSDLWTDDEVRIVGIVVRSYVQHFRR